MEAQLLQIPGLLKVGCFLACLKQFINFLDPLVSHVEIAFVSKEISLKENPRYEKESCSRNIQKEENVFLAEAKNWFGLKFEGMHIK